MSDIKQPSDHKKKDKKVEDRFTFTADGVEYVMPNRTLDVLTTKWLRLNRRRDEMDFAFTAIEELAGDDEAILDVIDGLDADERAKFMKAFFQHLGATQGE